MAQDSNGSYIPGIIVTIILLFLLCDIQGNVERIGKTVDEIRVKVAR